MTKSIDIDIAVIKNTMTNIEKKVDGLIVAFEKAEDRISDVENKQTALDTKLSGLAIFQVAFSMIVSAIASYLGMNKK